MYLTSSQRSERVTKTNISLCLWFLLLSWAFTPVLLFKTGGASLPMAGNARALSQHLEESFSRGCCQIFPTHFQILFTSWSLQLIPTAWLKVLVRKEMNCLSNTVLYYGQPFSSLCSSLPFFLHLFSFLSFPYESLSEILILQSIL